MVEHLYKQADREDDDYCARHAVQVLNRLFFDLVPQFSGIKGLNRINRELRSHSYNEKADLLGGFKVQLDGNKAAHHNPEHQCSWRKQAHQKTLQYITPTPDILCSFQIVVYLYLIDQVIKAYTQ